MQKIFRLVLTGGPCAGKTTAMSFIQNAMAERVYRVIFVPETATELITEGVAPWLTDGLEFQKSLFSLQILKENIAIHLAETMKDEKILIVFDRGLLDNKVFMTDDEWAQVLRHASMTETEACSRYDAVLHLVTAAIGAREFYTTANNAARKETPEQAAEQDRKIVNAWAPHQRLRIVDNSTDFNEKMKRTIREITAMLGEPAPYEIERKYLISYPDIETLSKCPGFRKVEIIQTYLKSEENEERRVRQMGSGNDFIFFETKKTTISGIRRIEEERRLSEKEYLNLLLQADTSLGQIRKTRYYLMSGNQRFEIDIYPGWKDQAIMEVELIDENEEIRFPECSSVIREVTEDAEYKNAALARKFIGKEGT